MKSANEFYITEGKKQTRLTFHSGGVKKERLPSGDWISRFTIETAENVFRFAICGDVPFRSRDVLELAPRFVRFRGGKRFDYPVYQLCKTEELAADERTARGLALDRAERKESDATGNKQRTAKNPKGAGANPKYDKKADEKIFKRWNKWRAEIGNGKRGRKAFIDEEQIDVTDSQLKKLIDRCGKDKRKVLRR